ncbi:hypothetical protein D3C78_1155980 [compost metagenome]
MTGHRISQMEIESTTRVPAQSGAIDLPRLLTIARHLEEIAATTGRRWPVLQLLETAAEVYNYLAAEGVADDEKITRVVRLVVGR